MTCTDWTNQLMDRAQPASARVEAARRLARECRTNEVRTVFCKIANEDSEDPVVRCAVVEEMPAWGHYSAVNFLYRIFQDDQVAATAKATLKKMGPVAGDMEVRLLADLSALREGNATFYTTANLPRIFGPDPRVLEYFQESLGSADKDVRMRAVTALCGLGEPAAVLNLDADPSPEVRAKLCAALGWNREQSGAGVLQRLLSDPYPEVANEAKIALRRLGRLERAKPGLRASEGRPESAWSRLLGEISRVRLAEPEVAVETPDSMVEACWLGEPGASEELIEAAEHRLGVRLPPSYRQFLAEANGYRKLGVFIYRLFGTAEIDWFHNLNPDWIEAYQIGEDSSPEEHLRDPSDTGRFRTAYLSSCLQISEEGDSAVVLLNPEVVTQEGEWEAWFFANWLPGARRYHSFREYMESELKSAHEFSQQKGVT